MRCAAEARREFRPRLHASMPPPPAAARRRRRSPAGSPSCAARSLYMRPRQRARRVSCLRYIEALWYVMFAAGRVSRAEVGSRVTQGGMSRAAPFVLPQRPRVRLLCAFRRIQSAARLSQSVRAMMVRCCAACASGPRMRAYAKRAQCAQVTRSVSYCRMPRSCRYSDESAIQISPPRQIRGARWRYCRWSQHDPGGYTRCCPEENLMDAQASMMLSRRHDTRATRMHSKTAGRRERR